MKGMKKVLAIILIAALAIPAMIVLPKTTEVVQASTNGHSQAEAVSWINGKTGTAVSPGTNDGQKTDITQKTVKKANPLQVKVSSKTFKRSKLKKAKKFLIGASKVQGKVTYTLNKKEKKAGIKVNKKGKVTIPKNCKKGTYKITVKAVGNMNYKAGSKTITVKVN